MYVLIGVSSWFEMVLNIRTLEFLEEIKDREYYMFPDEAKERGIVDQIIGIDCDIDEIL